LRFLQVYVPPRCGHGFFSFVDNSFVVYCQEGITWSSFFAKDYYQIISNSVCVFDPGGLWVAQFMPHTLTPGTFDGTRDLNILYCDPAIGIKWPEPSSGQYVVSPKDATAPTAAEALKALKARLAQH